MLKLFVRRGLLEAPLAPARGPPDLAEDFDQSPPFDPTTPEPVPDFDMDQSHW